MADSPNLPLGQQRGESRSRVCDNCIRQKVKCDQGRPQCSRCVERKLPCAYSSNRRKPGPIRGSRRARGARVGSATAPRSRRRAADEPPWDFHADLGNPETSISSASPVGDTPNVVVDVETQALPNLLSISPAEEESLLNVYFDTIHRAFPVFLESQVHQRGNGGVEAVAGCSRDLIQTLVLITARLSSFPLSSITKLELDKRIDQVLSSAYLQEDISGDAPSLDQFRKSCLLVFYEYHQCPGYQAWVRIGKLVRWAYWTGLDQLDRLHKTSPLWKNMSEDVLEEWRLVWWRIYCLDSYANLSTGMPYQIDESLVNTSLPRRPGPGLNRRICLPYQKDGLLQLVQDALSGSPPQTAAWEIQLISITILRHVGRALRLQSLEPLNENIEHLKDTERRLSALRLALPGNYFNPRRNAFTNESAHDHHFRLVTIHHILAARLLVALTNCGRLPEGQDWLQNWQQVLEICQDVVAIAKEWNSGFCLSVDPALVIISFVSLVFLALHGKFACSSVDEESFGLRSEIEHCQTVLLLFLHQFATAWTLPRLLILSFESFRESITCSVGYHQVRAILLRMESPLHSRWLQFLKSADNIMKDCLETHGGGETG